MSERGVCASQNPFRVQRVAAMLPFDPTWVGMDWEQIMVRLKSRRVHAVVGRHGSGKTTFLDGLTARLSASGQSVFRFDPNQPQSEPDFEPEIFVLDGAGRTSVTLMRHFAISMFSKKKLIFTAHRAYPGLPTLIHCRSTPKMLAAFVKQLAADWPMDQILQIWHRNRGNLRESLLECYDLCSEGREVRFANQQDRIAAASTK